MVGYQLHDSETEEILGSVIVTKEDPNNYDGATLEEAWEGFNKLEEYEGDTKNVDEFVVWFNENYVTQVDRLYLEFIQK